MVIPENNWHSKAKPNNIAIETIKIFRRTLPVAVPTINFLSGGQTPEEATANLNAINQPQLWNLSFSYGRALQEPVLKIWNGNQENIQKAQKALLERAKYNSQTAQGAYMPA